VKKETELAANMPLFGNNSETTKPSSLFSFGGGVSQGDSSKPAMMAFGGVNTESTNSSFSFGASKPAEATKPLFFGNTSTSQGAPSTPHFGNSTSTEVAIFIVFIFIQKIFL